MRKLLHLLLAIFAPHTDAEDIASGIVPTSRRYDRDLIERMQAEASA